MHRRSPLAASAVVVVLGLAASTAFAQAPGPYYARGTVRCSSAHQGIALPDSCYGYGEDVQLFDDGLHGDGPANDGLWGGDVMSNQPPGLQYFKIANADWSFAQPTAPGGELINSRVWTSYAGEWVHFQLTFRAPDYGWVPAVGVSNDHAFPAGMSLELMGSAPELGSWTSGLPADHVDRTWQRIVTIATPGTYEYKFRVSGTWNIANFGLDYNNNYGRNGTFTTTVPNTEMIIQFNEVDGRIRAIANDNVPARRRSWGELKVRYR